MHQPIRQLSPSWWCFSFRNVPTSSLMAACSAGGSLEGTGESRLNLKSSMAFFLLALHGSSLTSMYFLDSFLNLGTSCTKIRWSTFGNKSCGRGARWNRVVCQHDSRLLQHFGSTSIYCLFIVHGITVTMKKTIPCQIVAKTGVFFSQQINMSISHFDLTYS